MSTHVTELDLDATMSRLQAKINCILN